jgi:hypothetical protein
MGLSPLTWIDIDAWSRVRGQRPTFTELELIRVIDGAFLQTQAKKEK